MFKRKQKDIYSNMTSPELTEEMNRLREHIADFSQRLDELTEARATMDSREYTIQIQFVEQNLDMYRMQLQKVERRLAQVGASILRSADISLD